jgi:hypothetical protein
MGGWWGWTKWVLYYLFVVTLLLAIYIEVVQTRFECVIFSLVVLIYFELIAQYSSWGVELLQERDHRNEIHRLLSARLGAPIEAEMNKAIDDLLLQTQQAAGRHHINSIARFVIWLIVTLNILRAVFFW